MAEGSENTGLIELVGLLYRGRMSGHTIWKTFEYRSQVARAAPRLGGATVIVQGFYGGTCCLERRNEPEIPFSNVRGLVYSLGKTHYIEDFCREKQKSSEKSSLYRQLLP